MNPVLTARDKHFYTGKHEGQGHSPLGKNEALSKYERNTFSSQKSDG